ncbi:hypothetical protein BDR06DRAFT_952717 [Suillus hirtellus]|nr:hypothetical protein BDR06DRAFT_952717 [Suillus hirtellus]
MLDAGGPMFDRSIDDTLIGSAWHIFQANLTLYRATLTPSNLYVWNIDSLSDIQL